MAVTLGASSGPCSEEQLRVLEAALGARLPDDYRTFLRRHNGAAPEPNIFPVGEANGSGVNRFIPVSQILRERESLAVEIPPAALPIAWAEGGNYVLLDLGRDGLIAFWDLELPERLAPLSESFAEFLSGLRPFDTSDVELEPGQVQSAWIDPDFLKQFGQ